MGVSVRCVEIDSKERSYQEMVRIGVDPAGIGIMLPKHFHLNLKIEGLSPAQANILKQDMLSVGGDSAVSRGVVTCEVERTDAIVSGTLKQFSLLTEKLRRQPFGLPEIAQDIERAIEGITSQEVILKGRTRTWVLGRRTLVMGILNVTPDSFSDGGLYMDSSRALERALEMVEEGADIIDVGGESSRPGAVAVDEEEELRRVVPVVESLVGRNIPVSVDTTKSAVAERVLDVGVEMINDISALTFDEDMAGVCARYGAGVVLMHMRGTPQTMQRDVHYRDILSEIFNHLRNRIDHATAKGIEPERIVIDPGIGFGKSKDGNLRLIKYLGEFGALCRPILLGTSRKSFIGEVLGLDVEDRLYGTLATLCAGVLKGAHIVRVHDVKEARMVCDMIDAIREA